MPVIGPETIDVRCDGCGTEDELPATEYIPFPLSLPWLRTYGIDPATIGAEYWLAEGGKLFCPHCANVFEGADVQHG
jgi:hypothetical protein